MAKITLYQAVVLENAVEGPYGLRIWPAEALEPVVKAYRKRWLVHSWKDRPLLGNGKKRRGRPRKEKNQC